MQSRFKWTFPQRGSLSSPWLIIFKSIFILMFQVTASHCWAKASTSFRSNRAFWPPCPSSPSLVISSPGEDARWWNGQWVCWERSQPCTRSLTGKDRIQPCEFIQGCPRARSIETLYRSQTPGSWAGSADHGPTHETRLLSPLISSPISSSHL